MSPFEDFDLDLLKIQNMGGITPLNDDTGGGGSGMGSVSTSLPTPVWDEIATMVSRATNCVN